MLNNETLLKKSDQNLVWLDCEMTGLEPEKERLIEIAIIVTGPQLVPRIEGPVLVIHQSDEVLNQMDKWNKGTHGKSGLIDKVIKSLNNCVNSSLTKGLRTHLAKSLTSLTGSDSTF